MNTIQFLEALYGEELPGHLVIWTLEGRASHYHTSLTRAANDAVALVKQNKNVYFGVCLQNKKAALARDKKSRGFEDTVAAIPGFWIDIDIQGPGHKAQDLPVSTKEALDFTNDFPLPPTLIVHSGGGLHAYWLFKELIELESDEEIKAFATMSRRFQHTLIEAAKKQKWSLDNTADLARVLRLPGTMNLKHDPVEVKVLHYDEGSRYNPDDIIDYCLELPNIIDGDTPMRTVDPSKVLAGIPEGSRDVELFKYACSLRARGMDKSEAEFLVLTAAKNCSPPFPPDEAMTKLEQAWKYPAGTPRQIEKAEALEKIKEINEENVWDEEILGALALVKDEKPEEFAKIKQSLKGKVNLNDLTKTVNTYSEKRKKANLQLVDDDYQPPTLDEVFGSIGVPLTGLRKPMNWSITPTGVVGETKNGPRIVCRSPIVLTKRLKHVDSDLERIELAWYRDEEWNKCVVNRSTVFGYPGIMALADKGLPISSANARDCIQYLTDFEGENYDIFPVRMAVRHLGWVDKKTFIPGAQGELSLDLEEGMSQLASYYREEGDLDIWLNLIRPLREITPARFLMAASFASPLLSLVQQRVFVVHLWGDTTSGKTAALKAALSVWGEPERTMQSFNATKVALERTSSLLCDLPVGIDEKQVVADRQEFVSSLLYSLSSGQGRGRGTKSGDIQSRGAWSCIYISTGEDPLTQFDSTGGLKTRALEVNAPSMLDTWYARELHQKLQTHYGLAGPEFIRTLIREIKEDPDLIIKLYTQLNEDLVSRYPEHTGAHISYVAIIAVADFLASKWIWGLEDEVAGREAWELATTTLATQETIAQQSDALRSYQYFSSWLSANNAHFEDNPPGGTYYGWIDNYDNIVYVNPNIFDAEMSRGNFHPRRTLTTWDDRGWLVTSTEKDRKRLKLKKTCRWTGMRTYWVAVRLGVLDEEKEP